MLAKAEHVLDRFKSLDSVCLHRLPVLDGHEPGLLASHCQTVSCWDNKSKGHLAHTLLKVRDELLRLRARADALSETSVVLAGIEKDTVDKITVVVGDRDEGNLVVAAPARDVQGQVSLFIRSERESSKDRGNFLDEMVLHVPARADDVDSLEDTFALGILSNGMLLCEELEDRTPC